MNELCNDWIYLLIDRANGYAFAASEAKHLSEKSAEEQENESRLNAVFRWASTDLETTYHRSIEVFEKYDNMNSCSDLEGKEIE